VRVLVVYLSANHSLSQLPNFRLEPHIKKAQVQGLLLFYTVSQGGQGIFRRHGGQDTRLCDTGTAGKGAGKFKRSSDMDGWYATSRTRQRIRPTKVTRRRYSATLTAANKQIRKSHIETKIGRAATILNSCPKQGRKGLFFYFQELHTRHLAETRRQREATGINNNIVSEKCEKKGRRYRRGNIFFQLLHMRHWTATAPTTAATRPRVNRSERFT